jgi:hypothetical protein
LWSSVDSYQRRRRDVDCGPLLSHIRGGGMKIVVVLCWFIESIREGGGRRDIDWIPLLIHIRSDEEEGNRLDSSIDSYQRRRDVDWTPLLIHIHIREEGRRLDSSVDSYQRREEEEGRRLDCPLFLCWFISEEEEEGRRLDSSVDSYQRRRDV